MFYVLPLFEDTRVNRQINYRYEHDFILSLTSSGTLESQVKEVCQIFVYGCDLFFIGHKCLPARNFYEIR